MRTYRQLTQVQRYQIYVLRKTQHPLTEIAEVLGVHKSSISRELKRNRGQRGYRPQQAQALAVARRRKTVSRLTAEVWDSVQRLLQQDWSPEQISRRLKKEQSIRISHEWIYQHILVDKQAGGSLYKHLRCQKKRRKRYGIYDRRGQLTNCRWIAERPASVNTRKRIGDWEVDTLIGKQQKHAMLTLTERKSRFTMIGNLTRRTAQAIRQQVCKLLLPVKDKVHTLTSDHGREFADHELIADTLQLKFYFAHPYAA
jgi:IS30 family transposase